MARYVQPLVNQLDVARVAVLVTSDHATPCRRRAHSRDPVPFMLA